MGGLHAQILCASILLVLVCRLAEAQDNYPPCISSGITLNGTFGRIASPNYPSHYSDGEICHWIIQAPNATRIAIRFELLFEVETNDLYSCYDYIFFREASQTYDDLCGEQTASSFLSLSNELEVLFVADTDINMAGFSLNWTAVDDTTIPDAVTTVLTNDTGTVSSPNYPNLYGAFLDYTWIINTTSPEKHILLDFDSNFGIEGSNGAHCPYDSLVISEGDSAPSRFGSKQEICNPISIKRQLYKSNAIYVTFKSDSIISGIGFSFTYTAVDSFACSGFSYQNGTSGVVSTPLYPLAYEDHAFCKWLITVPSNMRIAIRFNTPFSIVSSTYCTEDYLALFDGAVETDDTQFLGHNLCGELPPRGFLSSGNQVLAVFVSQALSTASNIGFSFNWTAEVACQSDQFQCWDGTCINSTAKCNGTVDCPQDIADEASCSRENPTSCGIAEVAPVFKWDARILGGHEAAKGSWPWQGYIGLLSLNEYFFVCGAVLIDEEWALSAAHCMRNGKGLQYTATFGDYNLNDDDMDAKQNITIDGIFISTDYNATDTGYMNGTDLVLLHLSSPVNITKWVKPACLPQSVPPEGENLVVTGWGVKRPEHSADTKVDILRQVRVNVVAKETCDKAYGFTLSDTIFCAGISSGGASSCAGDSGGPALRLRNSSWEVAGLSSFASRCGVDPAIPTGYTNVYTLLPYINDVLANGMTPVTLVNNIINGKKSGVVSSPNYGKGNYPQGIHVRWHVIVSSDKRIEVRFNSNYDIEKTTFDEPCSADYMYVYDGSTTLSLKHGNKKLCGTIPPIDFVTRSNVFIVEFYTDFSFESTGFSLTWKAVDGCAENEMRCWNQSCIPAEKKCDGVPDCPGSEDEFECGFADLGPAVCGRPMIRPEFPFTPLVVGGHDSREGSWPWQIVLKAEFEGEYFFTCGGSLISEEWAISAAHCIYTDKYQIVIGDFNFDTLSPHEKTINVTTIIYPPEYNDEFFGDIAFLKLAEKVDFSSMYYQPICMPPPGDMGPPVNTTCVVTGWGVTEGLRSHSGPQTMQQTHVRILNDTLCHERLAWASNEFKRHYICAGHEHERANTCFGDSGGPLACFVNGTWVQYGVVSFGVVDCGARTYFQRVSLYLDLLEEAQAYRPCSDLQVIEASSGDLMPPIISGKYESNVDCSWLLKAPEQTIIQLQFKYFDLEGCQFYFYDYIHIYDGNSTSARKIFDEPLCDSRTLGIIESTTNQVLVVFISDSDTEKSGFHIVWEAKAACSESQLRCWDGSCVDASLKCDGRMDCLDQSDEKECPREGLKCGKQEVAPEFLWSSRIAGSSEVRNGSWPFQAMVTGNFLTCGGTILNEWWILTSAACVDLMTIEVGMEISYDITVTVGVYSSDNLPKSQQYEISEVYKHEKYKGGSAYDYDIAVLKLNKSLDFSATVQPACLARSDTMNDVKEGEVCVILGWGHTHPGNFLAEWLRQTRVPIMDPESCKKYASSTYENETMICAGNMQNGGPGACYDHGGPLFCFRDNVWVQFGVISTYQSCGATVTPDYYANVSHHMNWIEGRIGSKLPAPPTRQAETTSATTQSTAAVTMTSTAMESTASVTNASMESTPMPIASTQGESVTSTAAETTTSSCDITASSFAFNMLILAIQACIATFI